MTTVAERRRAFRALHQSGCFVLPNPWDIGSARYLARLGFKALATTSSGAAWSMGQADGAVPLEPMLEHIRAIAEATDLPVNADFLAGFARAPDAVAASPHNAARIPKTLLAAIEAPVPVQHATIACSARPSTTSRAAASLAHAQSGRSASE